MARALRKNPRFNQYALGRTQPDPSILAKPVQTFGYKGENRSAALTRMPEGYSRLVRDLIFRDGVYISRSATRALGAVSASVLVAAMEAVVSNGSSFPTRFTTAGVEVLVSNVWTATTGTAWTTTNLRAFSITGWADTIVFAEDTLGIYSMPFTGAYVKTVLTSLVGVKHLTTFAGRIVASLDNRIQWCVKNNNADWAGVGSGYEDLRSAPGGRPDAQTAVIPVSDDSAIVVRTGSVWQMNQTGDFDAPFQFTMLAQGKGGRWPRTVVGVPRGAMWLGDDGAVWKAELNGEIKDIGLPIYKSMQSLFQFLRLATATYDPRFGEFRINIPDTSTTQGKVFRYNLEKDLWTEDLYPFPIRSISFSLYTRALTIDELIGIINNLPGAIDDQTVGVSRAQVMFAMADPRLYVGHEDFSQNIDPLRDVGYDGVNVAGGFRLETGIVRAGSVLHTTEVVQLQLEYESGGTANVLIEYSDNGGTVWNSMLSSTISITTKPEILPIEGTLQRESLQFAVSSTASPNVRLADLFAMLRTGGMKVDAS